MGDRAEWWRDRPATTVAGDCRVFPPGHFHRRDDDPANDTGAGPNGPPIPLELHQVLLLQGFPPDYPVRGPRSSQFRQVGDAVPPPFARRILEALI